jgi:hypothetical protein
LTSQRASSDAVRIAALNDASAKAWRRVYRHLGWKTRNAQGAIFAAPNAAVASGIRRKFSLSRSGDTNQFLTLISESPSFLEKTALETSVVLDIAPDMYTGLTARLDAQPLWKSFHRLNLCLLADKTSAPLEYLREHFLPWFFDRYDSGRVDFVEPVGPFTHRMHAIRKFFQIDLDPGSAGRVDPPATLSRLHGFDALYLPTNEFSIWSSMFWPYIVAVPVPMSTCALIFHLGKPWDTREPAPSSVEKWWRDENLFSERDDTVAVALRIAMSKEPPTNFDDLLKVISILADPDTFDWYLDRVSVVREMAADFRLFRDQYSQRPDYAANLQLLLTLQRIVASTHYVCNYEAPFIAKGLLFDVADQYAAMAESSEGDQAQFFEWLFNSAQGGAWVQEALATVPGLGPYLSQKAIHLYRELDRSVDIGMQGAASTSRPHLVRLLRNARHGYWFRGDDLTKNLANYDGNLSNSAPRLAALWWLAFLQQPWQLLRRGVDALLVRTY